MKMVGVYGEEKYLEDRVKGYQPSGILSVPLHYKVISPLAELIDEHPALKPAVRAVLLPAVVMSSTVAVNTTLAQEAA